MDLKEAIRVMVKEEHLGDWVYDVRSRAMESGDGYKGNLWHHPRVNRFCEALKVLEDYSKD
jgi:hypothetical protein